MKRVLLLMSLAVFLFSCGGNSEGGENASKTEKAAYVKPSMKSAEEVATHAMHVLHSIQDKDENYYLEMMTRGDEAVKLIPEQLAGQISQAAEQRGETVEALYTQMKAQIDKQLRFEFDNLRDAGYEDKVEWENLKLNSFTQENISIAGGNQLEVSLMTSVGEAAHKWRVMSQEKDGEFYITSIRGPIK